MGLAYVPFLPCYLCVCVFNWYILQAFSINSSQHWLSMCLEGCCDEDESSLQAFNVVWKKMNSFGFMLRMVLNHVYSPAANSCFNIDVNHVCLLHWCHVLVLPFHSFSSYWPFLCVFSVCLGVFFVSLITFTFWLPSPNRIWKRCCLSKREEKAQAWQKMEERNEQNI